MVSSRQEINTSEKGICFCQEKICLLGDYKGGTLALTSEASGQANEESDASEGQGRQGMAWRRMQWLKTQVLGLSSQGRSGHSVCGFMPVFLWSQNQVNALEC